MFKLSDMVQTGTIVTGLKRKDKVGTVFSVTNPMVNGAKGFATLIGSKKDGTRIARFQHDNREFMFHTTNKTLWPNGETPIGKVHA